MIDVFFPNLFVPLKFYVNMSSTQNTILNCVKCSSPRYHKSVESIDAVSSTEA
jgi:hypothetical protein